MKAHSPEIINRKAKYEYQFIQTFEAGMQLLGTEVKSIRLGQANMTDAWCLFQGDELFLKNLHISEYEQASAHQHEPKRTRKLLMRKPELKKIHRKVKEKGYSLIPYRIFFSDRGLVKCEIVLAQGKKSFDKRDSIKRRDVERDMDRAKRVR